jgi:two-component system, cell cycle sensor histidine kinase and response regulator CckA
MIKMINNERLYRDQVQRIMGQTYTALSATLIGSIILTLALWNIESRFRIILWLASLISVGLIRLFMQAHFQKAETHGKDVFKRRNYMLITLGLSGCIWGSAGILIFPYTSLVHQVFMVFVLGGMVAGSVGVFASIKSAFYCFTIPTVLPIILNLFRIGSQLHYAMGAMLSIFWGMMLITAMKLNREIIEALNLKYENLELISDLKRENRDRKDAEQRLLVKNQQIEAIVHERTAELRNVNVKLINEIIERNEAEDALKTSEQKYRELADSLPQIVFETNEFGNITFLNSNTLKLTGYDESDLKKGINVLELLAPEDRERALGNIQKILNGAISHGNEYSALNKDKSTFPISVHANPIIRNSKYVGMRGIIIDLTEKKRADKEQQEIEAKLKRAEKMETLGIMAGGVAHDLNNILSGIVSYPELLLLQLPPDSTLKKPLLTMQTSGKKAAAIVQDLLTLTRRGVVNESPVNLNGIIEEYLQSPEYQKLMSFHPGVQMKVDLGKDLLRILGSPVHLTKTVMNLVSNAAEAMPNGGIISLCTRNQYLDRPLKGYDDIATGDYVVFSVSDNGIGISENDKNRIFEPFFTKKVMGRSGTGLGMSVVWGTVKDHKGYINVESAEGRGTVISLFFPITSREPDNEQPSSSIESCYGKGESILVVDDAKDQREIASTLLTQIGYSVTAVSSGEEALSYIKDCEFDLIVLDMIMDPGIDGLDTYRKILEIKPDQKAIIASGFSETSRVKEAQSLGVGAYVQKPYTLLRLGSTIKKELEKGGK